MPLRPGLRGGKGGDEPGGRRAEGRAGEVRGRLRRGSAGGDRSGWQTKGQICRNATGSGASTAGSVPPPGAAGKGAKDRESPRSGSATRRSGCGRATCPRVRWFAIRKALAGAMFSSNGKVVRSLSSQRFAALRGRRRAGERSGLACPHLCLQPEYRAGLKASLVVRAQSREGRGLETGAGEGRRSKRGDSIQRAGRGGNGGIGKRRGGKTWKENAARPPLRLPSVGEGVKGICRQRRPTGGGMRGGNGCL